MKYLLLLFLTFQTIFSQEHIQTIRPKSTALGVGMAIGATVLPVALGQALKSNELLVTGIVFGPSLGQFYAHDYSKALLFTLVRGAGVGLVAYADNHLNSSSYKFSSFLLFHGRLDGFQIVAKTAGLMLCVSGAVYSIYTTPKAVKNYNKKHNVYLMPIINPQKGIYGINLGLTN